MSQQYNLSLSSESKTVMVGNQPAFRIIGGLLAVTVIIDLFCFYLAFQMNTWQMFVLACIILVFDIIALVSLIMLRQGRLTQSIGLVIGGMLLIVPAVSLLIAEIGFISGLSLVFWTSILAVQTLPPKQANQAITVSIVVGIITALLDTLELNQRLILSGVQNFIPVMTVIVIIVYGIFLLRHFADYSLRIKLIIGFLIISLLSAGTTAVVSELTIRSRLEKEVINELENLSTSRSLAVGDLMVRQIEALETLSSNSPLVMAVQSSNLSYARGLSTEPSRENILADIKMLDKKWQAVPDIDTLIQELLLSDQSLDLTQFRELFPGHIQLFATDQYGAVIAATDRTMRYYYGDEAWWQEAFDNEQGDIYIGLPKLDQDNQTIGLPIAIPIYAPDSQEVIGVLHSHYDLRALANLLISTQFSTSGSVDLYFPDGSIIEGHPEAPIKSLQQVSLVHLNPDPFAELDPVEQANLELYYDDAFSLIWQSKIASTTERLFIQQLGWRVIAHENQVRALAPVEQQANNNFRIAFLIAIVSTIGAVFVSQRLATPIVHLTDMAQRIAAGDFTERLPVESRDEIGKLALAFNSMTTQLSQIIATLEERVAERTRQLETVVGVSQRLTGILDLSDLLRQVVTITKETFVYYHVHIYLLEGEMLVMAEGYGQTGIEMKRQNHFIPLVALRSLVARAAREGRTIIVGDVRSETGWLPNPLLPNTRSEMAVPIILGTEVVGVLDVQSEKVDGLTEEDKVTLEALANYVATGVRSARLFSQTQEALDETQKLQQLYTGRAWKNLAATQGTTDYEFRHATLPPLSDISTPEVETALQQSRTVDLRLPVATPDNTNGIEGDGPNRQHHNALATPLKLRGQTIGILGIHDNDPERHWTEDEIALIEAVSEQMSLAIENARLFEETGRRATREKIIADMTQQVWASGNLEKVMQTAAEQLGIVLDASKVVIRLGTEEQLSQPLSPDEARVEIEG